MRVSQFRSWEWDWAVISKDRRSFCHVSQEPAGPDGSSQGRGAGMQSAPHTKDSRLGPSQSQLTGKRKAADQVFKTQGISCLQ